MDEFGTAGAPATLHHYTDAPGLLGILASKGEIWATDARCLNDTGELELGLALIRGAAEERTSSAGPLFKELLAHPAVLQAPGFFLSLRARERLSRSPSRSMHPRWRRCSSVKYEQYAPSSRLAIRAPRPRSSTDSTFRGP
jgi:hypothetical protein